MLPKPKVIPFDEEMRKDFEQIQRNFKEKFGVTPSSSSIMDLLLKTYKHSKLDIRRKPKSRKKFLVEM
jgi:hypothetical protein